MKRECLWKVAAMALLLLIFNVGLASAKVTLKKGGLIHARYAEASAISVEKP